MKTKSLNLVVAVGLVLILTAISVADPIPNPYSMRTAGDVWINGSPAPAGTYVRAYADGVWCGADTVGDHGKPVGVHITPVYGDDPWNDDDHQAEAGDAITYTVNGRPATATIITPLTDLVYEYQGNIEVDLYVDDATYGMTLVGPSPDRLAHPGETISVALGIRNDGNGIDNYGIDVTAPSAWTVTKSDTPPYADAGQTIWVWFDLYVDTWGGASETISYSVYSNNDPGTSVGGSFVVTKNIDDVYAMTLISAPSNGTGVPGASSNFAISVRNDGNMADTYDISAVSDLGWTVTPGSSVAVNPGQTVELSFSASIPGGASDGDVSQLDYTVASAGDGAVTIDGSITLTADVSAVYNVVVVDNPIVNPASPDDEVLFEVGVRNAGNVADQYYISAVSDLGWPVRVQAGNTPANPTETVYVRFWVTVPAGVLPGETSVLDYTVHSVNNVGVSANGSTTLQATPTDVDDDGELSLPDRVALAQNYPNPFNPTTTIAFSLPGRSTVSLDIINVLGQRVDGMDLGALSGGDHSVEYDASALSSGVYFYRLTTERGAETRKMVLLK